MAEIDLMKYYPRSQKPIESRATVSKDDMRVARKFERDYFDGDRKYGYGGYFYNAKFWSKTVKYIKDYYNLPNNASILDVGCGKGFMLNDFKILMPEVHVAGIDISNYAYEHALPNVKPYIKIGNAKKLPFPDKSFDLVIGINVVHNLALRECKQAIKEIERVSRLNKFIVVDAWRNKEELIRHNKWVVTCKTAMHVSEWSKLFDDVGYSGDYYWTFS
jgi:ubiquinone/menaquinone biosynthesis C-methylase UbiE